MKDSLNIPTHYLPIYLRRIFIATLVRLLVQCCRVETGAGGKHGNTGPGTRPGPLTPAVPCEGISVRPTLSGEQESLCSDVLLYTLLVFNSKFLVKYQKTGRGAGAGLN